MLIRVNQVQSNLGLSASLIGRSEDILPSHSNQLSLLNVLPDEISNPCLSISLRR